MTDHGTKMRNHKEEQKGNEGQPSRKSSKGQAPGASQALYSINTGSNLSRSDTSGLAETNSPAIHRLREEPRVPTSISQLEGSIADLKSHIRNLEERCMGSMDEAAAESARLFSPGVDDAMTRLELNVQYLIADRLSLEDRVGFLEGQLTALSSPAPVQSVQLTKRPDEATDESNSADSFVKLSADFLMGSGLASGESGTILYKRQSCAGQIEFIREVVLEQGSKGFIFGQPGTGKSVTSFYVSVRWAAVNQWRLTWVHITKDGGSIVQTCGCLVIDEAGNRELLMMDVEEFVETLESVIPGDSPTVLVIDGLTNDPKLRALFDWSVRWQCMKTDKRRLLHVSSMGSSGARNPVDDESRGIKVFRQLSWTLSEYMEALKHEDFVSRVSENLDACDVHVADRSLEQRTLAKFHYAGGCARWMFQWKTREVMKAIAEAVQAASKLSTIVDTSCGNHSPDLANSLISIYTAGDVEVRDIVSRHAAWVIACQLGPTQVKMAAQFFEADGNPALSGWFLEIFLFACARTGRIKLLSKSGLQEDWNFEEAITSFSPSRPTRASCPENCWLKPLNFNNPGYDAVILIAETATVRFVQISRKKERAINLSPSLLLLAKLVENDIFSVKSVEFFVICPTSILLSAKVTTIQSPAAFATHGWPSDLNTMRECIQIRGIDFDA